MCFHNTSFISMARKLKKRLWSEYFPYCCACLKCNWILYQCFKRLRCFRIMFIGIGSKNRSGWHEQKVSSIFLAPKTASHLYYNLRKGAVAIQRKHIDKYCNVSHIIKWFSTMKKHLENKNLAQKVQFIFIHFY